MSDTTIDLPFGDAFGPGQLSADDDEEELVVVLDMVAAYTEEPADFDRAVADAFFSSSSKPLTRAENVRFALQTENGYDIVDGDFQFTPLGEELCALRDDPAELYDRFATHILQNLHGREVIETIHDLEALSEQTTESNIRQHLADHYDIHLGEGSNHWSQMRAWLSKAGLINTGTHLYEIDEEKLVALTGMSPDELSVLEELPLEQQAFLWTLAIVNPEGSIENSTVRRAAEVAFGVNIDQSNITRRILDPLSELGYIEFQHADGAPNVLQTTSTFDQDVLESAMEIVSRRVGIPSSALRTSFTELAASITSPHREHDPALVARTLAVKLGSLLELDFIGWRRTTGQTATAVFDRVDQSLDRWLVTMAPYEAEISAATVSRALGGARSLGAGTLLIVGRIAITQDARRIANQIVQQEPTTILLVTIDDIAEFDTQPDRFSDTVEAAAKQMQRVRALADDQRYAIDGRQQLELQSLSQLEQEIFPDTSAEDRSLDEF